MTNPREYAEYTGFTEDEVKGLCENIICLLMKLSVGMTAII